MQDGLSRFSTSIPDTISQAKWKASYRNRSCAYKNMKKKRTPPTEVEHILAKRLEHVDVSV